MNGARFCRKCHSICMSAGKVQMRRIARINGISGEAFESDDKFAEAVGPKVMTYEALLILMERTEDESVFRV